MKNLKDYLGTKTAIACRTTEQAKFVNEFLSNNGGRSLFDKWKNRKSMLSVYHNCLEFSLDTLPNNMYCHEGWVAQLGYTILEASEFMPSLIGRKIKALINLPNGGVVRKDEIGIITEVCSKGLPSKADFPSQSGYAICYGEDKYELLPIDYQESTDELKVGDLAEYIGDYKSLKIGKVYKITFCGIHNNNHKVMTAELDLMYPNKEGWRHLKDFRKLTPEEVLAYNRQSTVKDDFVLPEKWAVKRTSENHNILNNWCNNQKDVYGTSDNKGWVHSHNYGDDWIGFSGGHYYANCKLEHPDHTEITFEQFKQYILNKQPIYEKPLTPKECFNTNDPTDIVIPKINKPVVKPDFTISNKLMDIDIPLNVKSVKHVKPITINQFSLTI